MLSRNEFHCSEVSDSKHTSGKNAQTLTLDGHLHVQRGGPVAHLAVADVLGQSQEPGPLHAAQPAHLLVVRGRLRALGHHLLHQCGRVAGLALGGAPVEEQVQHRVGVAALEQQVGEEGQHAGVQDGEGGETAHDGQQLKPADFWAGQHVRQGKVRGRVAGVDQGQHHVHALRGDAQTQPVALVL